MIRLPPRSTRTDTSFPTRRSSDLFGNLGPALADLDEIGHVRHRTAGSEVRQDHGALAEGQNVGNFSHEMHAAEHAELGIRIRGESRQLPRVAGEIGVLAHQTGIALFRETVCKYV